MKNGQEPDALIVLAVGSEFFALTRTELDAARARARELGLGVATHGAEPEHLVDSARLAEITNLPQSWLEEAARQSLIPTVKCGKYVRYQPSRVIAALTGGPGDEHHHRAPAKRAKT